MPVRELWRDVVDLVLPRGCIGCGAAGAALCATCRAPSPQLVPSDDLQVVAAARYDGGLRRALIAYKERGRRDLAPPLGALLARAVEVNAVGGVLVPVPSTRAARRSRGHDHVRRLAREVRRPCRPALAFSRAVQDSAGLSGKARAANLAGAMRAQAPPVRGLPAVVVDDITTTGATLAEAARALRAAGWSVDAAAVVAATALRA